MKILVIENDVETLAYVARGLREQGHVVDLAANGRGGLFWQPGSRNDDGKK
jgi:two-component system OmpR family response regulator